MSTVIEVESLRKTYGDTVAVDGISFQVEQGEIFGILGPNGAGKTTTVECLQGLRHADSGHLRVLGLDPRSQSRELQRRIGSQLQESALPDRIRVWEALDLFAAAVPNAADWQVLIEQWGIAEKRKAAFSSLSGGQRQRLFIALALVSSPEVVFLDEMTTGLDPAARHVAWDLVRKVREKGTTVILVTHFMDEAEYLCDRLAVVNKGKTVAIGSPQELIDRHTTGVKVSFSSDAQALSWLDALAEVDSVARQGSRVEIMGHGPALATIAHALVEHEITPLDLRMERPSLEEVFLNLTGHTVED